MLLVKPTVEIGAHSVVLQLPQQAHAGETVEPQPVQPHYSLDHPSHAHPLLHAHQFKLLQMMLSVEHSQAPEPLLPVDHASTVSTTTPQTPSQLASPLPSLLT